MRSESRSDASSSLHIPLATFVDRMKFVFFILKNYKAHIAFFIALEIIGGLLTAIVPYFTKLQIDQLQSQLGNIQTAFWLFGLALFVPVAIDFVHTFVFQLIRQNINRNFQTGLRVRVEQYIWAKLETLDNGFFENLRNRRLLSWMLSSTGSVSETFDFFLGRLNNLTVLLSVIPLLAYVQWQLMVLVVGGALVQMIITDYARKQEQLASMVSEQQNERLWEVQDALSRHFQVLRSFGASQKFLDELHQLYRERDRYSQEQAWQKEKFGQLQWLTNNIVTIAVHLFAGWQVLNGNITLGSFTLVVSYTGRLNAMFSNLLVAISDWQMIQVDFDRLNFFFLLRSRIRVGEHVHEKVAVEVTDKLELKNIHFTYPDLMTEERSYIEMMIKKSERFLNTNMARYFRRQIEDWQELLKVGEGNEPVLKGVDMSLERGKVIALLGRNGAGKTTITQLLMHQHEPTEGQVLLNGEPLYHYAQQPLVEQFAVIQQRPFILERFSVRENLVLGIKRAVSDDEIWLVLERVDLKERIQFLPKGLDTVLGEEVSLSGGQEQLLAVCRVFLQQRPFVLFDEGMNQMDIEHEMKVMDVLREQRERSAILFITHRITTARKADYIYMLDGGKVVEEGTHADLITRDGLYAAFWKMQVIE